MAMNLFRRAAEPEAQKASRAASVLAFHDGCRAVWTPRDMASMARSGYEKNAIGFRAVRMVAEAAATVPLVLSEDGVRMAQHPLLGLMEQPNPGQDGRTLLEALYGHLQLSGNAYVEAAAPDTLGLPRELYVLRPDRMRVVPGKDGWPSAYEYHVSGKALRWAMTEDTRPILHLKAFHPLDDHYGMSPLEAAAQAIDVHNSAASWSKALLDNAARPSGAIVFGSKDGSGTMSEEQYKRLTEEIETNHAGARNAGRPMLLEGGLDWRPMSHSPSDMEFLETKNAAAREIAMAFGVPPMLLGLPGDNTYANYQEANRAFYRQTVLPLVRKTLAALASWICHGTTARLSIAPDLDQVPALGPEREALWKRVSEADFLDEAEKRALLGLAPRDAQSGDA